MVMHHLMGGVFKLEGFNQIPYFNQVFDRTLAPDFWRTLIMVVFPSTRRSEWLYIMTKLFRVRSVLDRYLRVRVRSHTATLRTPIKY